MIAPLARGRDMSRAQKAIGSMGYFIRPAFHVVIVMEAGSNQHGSIPVRSVGDPERDQMGRIARGATAWDSMNRNLQGKQVITKSLRDKE